MIVIDIEYLTVAQTDLSNNSPVRVNCGTRQAAAMTKLMAGISDRKEVFLWR